MKARSLIPILVFVTQSLLAQNQRELDSLFALLPTVTDTTEVKVLYHIARFQLDREPDVAARTSLDALNKSKALDYRKGKVMAYKQLGTFRALYGNNIEDGFKFLDSAAALAETAPEKVSLYTSYAMICSMKGQFEKSHGWLIKALDLLETRDTRQVFHIYTYMAYNLSHLRRLNAATEYYKKCVDIAERKGSVRDIGVALSNLGLSYVERGLYDSALSIHQRLYAHELKHGNPLANPTLLSELGKLYFERGDIDTAYYFMHTGLRASRELNIPYAITRSLSTLGRYHLRDHPDSALFYGRKLMQAIDRNSIIAFEDVYYILSQAHGKLKRYDSSIYYNEKYILYHDSVFQEKQTQQIAEMEAAFELKHKEQEIGRLEQVRQNLVLKRNALTIGLALTMIIALLMYFYLQGRVRARKKEIEIKNWQLESFTRKMVEKSELVEELRSQLEQFRAEVVIPKERIENVSQILHSSILTDDDWEQFKSLFEQVHQNFFAELKIKYPSLTQAEIRIAALIKLNISTREMANMLGISVESANKARYRLRKKLELLPEEDLQDIIEKVSEPQVRG